MAGKLGQDYGSNQMRWVILLLSLAVILPTVCLLWFMAQAVKNERLAVRQKLIDVYSESAQHFFVEVPDSYLPDVYIKPVEDKAESPLYKDNPSSIYDFTLKQILQYEKMVSYE